MQIVCKKLSAQAREAVGHRVMRLGISKWLVGASLLVGCATSSSSSTGSSLPPLSSRGAAEPEHPAVTPEAQRRYAVGEVAYGDGRYAEAVSLFREALLALPPTKDADDLRHALILRIAHTQLMAWQSTGDRAYLEDAERMLLRYADRHESLFGTSPQAQAQRGDVYEILYAVEAVLDPEPPPDDSADADQSEPGITMASDEEREALDDHAGEEVGEQNVRRVVVKQSRLANLDDPAVRQRLSTSFSTPWAGLQLTKGVDGKFHGPRPLLRFVIDGLDDHDSASPEARQWARRAGRELMREARPALRECYRSSFARDPVEIVRGTVAIDIDAQGKVRGARVRSGGLDAIGNACVETRLTAVATADAPKERRRLVVDLTFFYEGAKFLQGSLGGDTGTRPDRVRPGTGNMPDIDKFDNTEPSIGVPKRRRRR